MPLIVNMIRARSAVLLAEQMILLSGELQLATDILSGAARLPFTSRLVWLQTQQECPDLHRVHAHLTQGIQPLKKETKIKDVKRYLQVTTIGRDGLLVQHNEPLSPACELIIVPRQVIDGLLSALHIQLAHPSRNQLRLSVQRAFYALDMEKALKRVTEAYHLCSSLKYIPPSLQEQSTENPPKKPGISFAADVMKRARQLILVLRETVTSYTRTCFLDDEMTSSLRSGLMCMCLELCPMDGSQCAIRVDGAPGFKSLVNDKVLKSHNMRVEIGRAKNVNRNPVAEHCIQESESEIT